MSRSTSADGKPTVPERVSRDDIEARLRTLQSGFSEKVERTKGQLLVGAAVITAAILGITFLLGKRKGRKSTTVVEIRRV